MDGFGLLDVIDVLILAVLIYQAYVLLIGSRAWNVFRGMAALTGLWFLATQLGLGATSAVFDRWRRSPSSPSSSCSSRSSARRSSASAAAAGASASRATRCRRS
jgi:hypothetical protein